MPFICRPPPTPWLIHLAIYIKTPCTHGVFAVGVGRRMTRGLATCNSADRAWTSCLRRSWPPSQVSGTHLNTFSSSTTLRWALAAHHSVHVRIHRTNIWSVLFKKQRLSEQCIGMNGEKWQRCIYLGERSSYLCHLVRPVSPLIPRTSSFVQIKALHSFDRVFLLFKTF